MRRVRTFVAAAAVATALVPAHAGAAGKLYELNERVPIAVADIDNPCTPVHDHISMSGVLHVLSIGFQGRILGRYALHVAGSDALGTHYVTNESNHMDARTSGATSTFSVAARSNMISGSSAANSMVRIVTTMVVVDGVLVTSESRVEATCI